MGELVGVMVEVGLDLPSTPVERVYCFLGMATEAGVELLGAAIREVGDPPCNAESDVGPLAGRTVVVIATGPVRIGPDGS